MFLKKKFHWGVEEFRILNEKVVKENTKTNCLEELWSILKVIVIKTQQFVIIVKGEKIISKTQKY